MLLNSKKFPNIKYDPGDELFYTPEEINIPFYFDVDEELTNSLEYMDNISLFLDDIEKIKLNIITYIHEKIEKENTTEYDVIRFFLEIYNEENYGKEDLRKVLGVDNIENVSLHEKIDLLKINRVGSLLLEEGTQGFIIDFSFNMEYTDELLVVYLNLNREIVKITHES